MPAEDVPTPPTLPLAVLDGVEDGVVLVDARRCVSHMNPAAGRLLGVAPDDSRGRALADVAPVLATLVPAMATSAPSDGEQPSRETVIDVPAPFGGRLAVRFVALPDGVAVLVRGVDEEPGPGDAPRTEDRLRLVGEAIDAIIYDWDLVTGRLAHTGGLESILGYPPDEVEQTVAWWRDRLHPDDLSGLIAQRDDQLAASGRSLTEHRVRHRDGSYRVLRASGRIVGDAAGRVTRMVGTSVDITELREAAESLLRHDRRAERMATLARALARAADPDEVVAAILGEGFAVTGAASEVVASLSDDGTELRILGSVGLREDLMAEWRVSSVDAPSMAAEAVRAGEMVIVATAEERWRRFPHHRSIHTHVGAGVGVGIPLVAGGRTVGTLSLTYAEGRPFTEDDLADLRAMADLCAHALARALLLDRERTARAEAERLREEFAATFDHAPIGVAHTDREHRWLRFNRKLCEITGYSADELRHLDWRAITHPDDLAAQLALERRMLDGEIPGFTIEKRYLRKDGAVIWIRLSTATVRQEGQPIYSVAMIEEITERRWAEADAAFLAELDRRIRPLAGADAIAAETVAALATYLAADRCVMRGVDDETWTLTTVAEWAAPGQPTLGPTDSLAAWEVAALERARAEHRAFRIADAAADPRVAPAADRLAAIGVRALLGGTFVQGGRWVALLSVATATPRAWRDDEAALLQAVLDRVWPQLAAARAADRLRRSEERYRAIVASTTSTVFTLDADGRADDAFAAWWQGLTGQGRAELSGWGWLDVVAPEDRATARAEQGRGIAERTAFESAYRVSTVPGEVRHLLVRGVPLLDGDGAVREWFGTVTDVTDARRQEAALARQANLLDQAYDAFIARELDGAILFWNQGAERLYGFTQAEALGRVSHELLRTTHADGREAMLAELEATGATEVELTHVAKDGRAVMVRSRHQVVQDGDRRIVLEANRDVTELKALERAQQDFTAAASHDLKNPIGTIKAEAQLTLRRLSRGDAVDPERLARSLSTIDRLTDTLTGLVNDLVDVSVLRSGRTIELAPEPTDLGPVVERAVGLHRPRYGGEIALTLPNRPVLALVDERRLDRVLGNLLGNAAKFSPALGPIDIELRTAERGGRPVAEVVVRDAGVGIPAADLPVVFERFQRGSNVGGVAGTGIGLAGARRIVEQHGGTITVESVEGAGSAFTVRLPLDGVGESKDESGIERPPGAEPPG